MAFASPIADDYRCTIDSTFGRHESIALISIGGFGFAGRKTLIESFLDVRHSRHRIPAGGNQMPCSALAISAGLLSSPYVKRWNPSFMSGVLTAYRGFGNGRFILNKRRASRKHSSRLFATTHHGHSRAQTDLKSRIA
jgi:hypothetical protein